MMSIPSFWARFRLPQGGIARLACARARRAGIELMPLLKKARLIDQQVKDRGARLPWTYQSSSVQISAGVGF